MLMHTTTQKKLNRAVTVVAGSLSSQITTAMASGVPVPVVPVMSVLPPLRPLIRRPRKDGRPPVRHVSFTQHIYEYSPHISDYENRGWVLTVPQIDRKIALCMAAFGLSKFYYWTVHYDYANQNGYHMTLVCPRSSLTPAGLAVIKPTKKSHSVGSMRVFAPIPRTGPHSTTAGIMTEDQLRYYCAGLVQLRNDIMQINPNRRGEITIFPSPKGKNHHRLTGTIHR
jgi:hypothetical protein